MKTRLLLLVVFMLWAMASMAIAREAKLTPTRVTKLFTRGKTTKAEIVAAFGKPATKHPGAAGVPYKEMFTYSDTVGGRLTVLLVPFDGRARVTGYMLSQK